VPFLDRLKPQLDRRTLRFLLKLAANQLAIMARHVGNNGQVICVEAHPRTFRCLQKLVEYKRLENVVTIHCAVSEPDCAETVIQDSSEYLRNRVGGADGFRVAARTIDSIADELGLSQIHFLKMNIEGAERWPSAAWSRPSRGRKHSAFVATTFWPNFAATIYYARATS
jgi:FkbM family methyltransferase